MLVASLFVSLFLLETEEAPWTSEHHSTTMEKTCHDSFYPDRSNETPGSLLSVKQTADLCADATQLGHQRDFPLQCPPVSVHDNHHSTPVRPGAVHDSSVLCSTVPCPSAPSCSFHFRLLQSEPSRTGSGLAVSSP